MNKIETKAKLIVAALQIVTREQAETFTLPGPHDDAEAEYHDDILLSEARAFVAAHADVRIPEEDAAPEA